MVSLRRLEGEKMSLRRLEEEKMSLRRLEEEEKILRRLGEEESSTQLTRVLKPKLEISGKKGCLRI